MATSDGRERSPTPARGRARSSPPRAVDAGARDVINALDSRMNGAEAIIQTMGQQLSNMSTQIAGTVAMATGMATMDSKIKVMENNLLRIEGLMANFQSMLSSATSSAAAASGVTIPPGIGAAPPQQTGRPPQEHAGHSNGAHKKILYSSKDAQQSLPNYDGTARSDADYWYKKTRNHLISQHRDLKPFLDWSESKGATSITMSDVQNYGGMLDLDPKEIANEVWGFLNSNLIGEAHNSFLGVEETNGAEAWRKVVHGINGKTPVRRLTLKAAVDAPEEAKDMAEVMAKIEKWEEQVRKYVRAGGRDPDDEEKRATVLRIAPTGERINLIRKEFVDYAEMREYVRAQSELHEHLGLHRSKDAGLHVAHEKSHETVMNQSCTHEHDLSKFTKEELMVLVKGKGKGKGKNASIVCYGCGQTGHPQRLCPQAGAGSKGGMKGMWRNEQKGMGKGYGGKNPNIICYGCGQKGHPQRLCPMSKGKGKGGAYAIVDGGNWGGYWPELEGERQTSPISLNAATDDEGGEWQQPKNTVRQPTNVRSPFTLNDFINVNRFENYEENNVSHYALYETKDDQEDLQVIHSQPAEEKKKKKKKTKFRPMLDSGAGEFVCSRKHAPNITVNPSNGSKRGQTFGTAGKDVLKNEGEQRFTISTPNNERLRSTWQTADVSRPLMGVGRVCDMDDRGAFFDKECGKVLDRETTEAIRRFINERGVTLCRFEREGGIYVLDGEIEDEDVSSGSNSSDSSGTMRERLFPRQGK